MSKVHVVLIGSNDGLYGGYADRCACQEMAPCIMNALYDIRKRVAAEHEAASSAEDAGVVLVIVLTCPSCDSSVSSKIRELRQTGKRVVVTTPLEGSSDADVAYNFKATMMPYFPGFVSRPETNPTCEDGIATAGEYTAHIIEGVLGALDEELADQVASEGLPTLDDFLQEQFDKR